MLGMHPDRGLSGFLVLAAIATSILACAQTRVESRTAPDAEWSQYERFTIATAGSQPIDEQVVAELRSAMRARGFTESPEAPQLTLSYRISQAQRTKRTLAPEPDANTYQEVSVLEKTLLIEARDAATDAIVWTGRGTTPLRDADAAERSVPGAIEAIFRSFPRAPLGTSSPG